MRADPTREAVPIRVLIVDDDRATLEALERTVSASGVEVVATTDSGEHAVDLARLLEPDLALIDWNMPHFGGALTARLVNRYAPKVATVILVEDGDDVRDTTGRRGGFPAIRKDAGREALQALLAEFAEPDDLVCRR